MQRHTIRGKTRNDYLSYAYSLGITSSILRSKDQRLTRQKKLGEAICLLYPTTTGHQENLELSPQPSFYFDNGDTSLKKRRRLAKRSKEIKDK